MAGKKRLVVEDVLTESQLNEVVKKCVGESARWQLVAAELRPAAEGVAGFLGDHSRLALTLKVEDRIVKIPLFMKSVPISNSAKAEFINKLNFFRKEKVMFKLIEKMEKGSPDPWHSQAHLYSDTVLVMSDLAPQGYSTLNQLETFDLAHVRVALASIARFHAATANYETRQQLTLGRPYCLSEEFGEGILEGVNHKDTPWMRAGTKLIADFIQVFSDKHRNTIPDLESKVTEHYLKASNNFVETIDSLNVAVHQDLWGNNIMFRYEDGVPANAILLDFQCLSYAPPAFDVMQFWHFTTMRSFREDNEAEVLRHYFTVFIDSVDENTKLRLKRLGYDYGEFLRWVERSRRSGLCSALMLFPSVLMDASTAAEVFDDPSTFHERFNKDRSEPVLAYARRCPKYLRRLLEASEEFIERYLQA